MISLYSKEIRFLNKSRKYVQINNIFLFNKSIYISVPTQESGTDVFGDLVARLARLRKMAQLLVEHPFELEKREENKRIYTRLLQAVV